MHADTPLLVRLGVGVTTQILSLAGVGGTTALEAMPRRLGTVTPGDVEGIMQRISEDFTQHAYFVTGNHVRFGHPLRTAQGGRHPLSFRRRMFCALLQGTYMKGCMQRIASLVTPPSALQARTTVLPGCDKLKRSFKPMPHAEQLLIYHSMMNRLADMAAQPATSGAILV